jgi:hypothetical protein
VKAGLSGVARLLLAVALRGAGALSILKGGKKEEEKEGGGNKEGKKR